MGIYRLPLLVALGLCFAQLAHADADVDKATQNDKAFAKYGLTGKGVIVAILDRGIDYTHWDFRNPDGTTRIKMMWDMSNVNPQLSQCDPGQPAPIVYTEAQINESLRTNAKLGERDAVGHGTVSTGLAAGNGRAALPTSIQWAGIAPAADLLIVKMTSEGAERHDGEPPEDKFQGCTDVALDLVSRYAAVMGEPIVALMDSGVQWGPIDGTSAVSRKIDAAFGADAPGRVYVAASGDEGSLQNHARATYGTNPAVISFQKSGAAKVEFQLWYTGAVPAEVELTLDDTATSVRLPPGDACANSPDGRMMMCTYIPGKEFYPWTSSGSDRAVWIYINGHSGTGRISVKATQAGSGTVDAYGDALSPTPTITYTDHPTTGRLTDYASTASAIVVGCSNVRTHWRDVGGNPQTWLDEGETDALWLHSSGGPTRDGRSPTAQSRGGVDIVAPGGNSFAAYSATSLWGDRTVYLARLIQGGAGLYGWHSATSAAAPIVVGAVALLLELNPTLTAGQIRQYLRESAVSDRFTGTTPHENWGAGKLNILGAADRVAAGFRTNPTLSSNALTFPPQEVGTPSAAQEVTFSNADAAMDALGITSILADGDFQATGNNCGTNLPAGSQCRIEIVFKPSRSGIRRGALTIKNFNGKSPHVVALVGTGS